jgi:PTH1 family peptidyl-tRNA hydrolase
MTLVVGLGNIGTKYELTRHNIGFMVVDSFVNDLGLKTISKASFKGEVFKSNDFILLKPHTYMNLSGESVISVKNFYKCDDLIVIHDDLDLGFGCMKFKIGGSSGGHNGLKSIDKHYGNEYKRVRLGIGRPKDNQPVVDFVLRDFDIDEKECLDTIINSAKVAIQKLLKDDLNKVSSTNTVKKFDMPCKK